jgi:hypothetical protein
MYFGITNIKEMLVVLIELCKKTSISEMSENAKTLNRAIGALNKKPEFERTEEEEMFLNGLPDMILYAPQWIACIEQKELEAMTFEEFKRHYDDNIRKQITTREQRNEMKAKVVADARERVFTGLKQLGFDDDIANKLMNGLHIDA